MVIIPKKLYTPIYFFFVITLLNGREEFFNDKIMIYIDNKITDFQVMDDQVTTSISGLNDLSKEEKVNSIQQWLPNARPNDRNADIYLARYFVVEFEDPKDDLDDMVNKFLSIDQIRYSEKMGIIEPAYVPNDSLWDQLYGLPQVKADLAYDFWDIDGGILPGQMESGEIVVAIPDIGLKWDHPDLIDNIWQNLGEDADGDGVVLEFADTVWVFDPGDTNGIDDDEDGYIDNFIGYDPAMSDNDPAPLNKFHEHGTKVAGNVSAVTNNGIGLASVGFSVKLMGVNANNNIDEPWYLTHTNQAVLAAAQMGADIINCSWVSLAFNDYQYNLFNTVKNEYGCITVAAAGNGVSNGGVEDTTDFNPRYPAAYDNTVSVTALGENSTFNCWANVHETVDIGAPGEFIICAMPRDDELYALGTGTSYATPLTAGAIALVKSVIPDADNEVILSKIIHTAEYYPDMDRTCVGQELDGLLGSGQLNVYRAILACYYPELSASEIDFQTDDGFVNPGDTVVVNVTVANSMGFEAAENVIATLSTNDSLLTVINDQIVFDDAIPGGEELTGQFIITSPSNALLGDIVCNIHFSATSGETFYETDIEFQVPLSLGQFGYPIENINVQTAPIITDLDGNSLKEIYFSADSMMYGTWVAGFDVPGFPFDAGIEIGSSPAAGDLDGNGDKELVFGSTDGILYALTKTGTQHVAYGQSDPIMGAPALCDMDQDGDLEIIFVSGNETSGALYAIHDTGDDVTGFPLDIPEKMVVGPAVADLDNDGVLDIVIVTSDSNIYAVDGTGIIKDGFPFITSASLSSPATLVDLDGDQDLEIAAGNENGELYVLHHDGSLMASFSAGDAIRGGISVADINGNGSLELLFTGYDNHVHAWDPVANTEAFGWPVDLGTDAVTEPLTADLDNDGDLEVVTATITGTIHINHHDGTPYQNFPYSSQDSIYSTPAIGDLDNDGDYELIVGTLMGLQVIDMQEAAGDRYSWQVYRGNAHRDGYFDVTLASITPNKNVLPTEYSLGNNYPNPFNPITRFTYSLPEDVRVSITVYDIKGRAVKTLVDSEQSAGYKSIQWNATNDAGAPVSTGLYFYIIQAGNFNQTKKMILLK